MCCLYFLGENVSAVVILLIVIHINQKVNESLCRREWIIKFYHLMRWILLKVIFS